MRQEQTTGRQVTREMPDPDPTPPAAPVAMPIPATHCSSCDGEGWRRVYVGGGLSDWVSVGCFCRRLAA